MEIANIISLGSIFIGIGGIILSGLSKWQDSKIKIKELDFKSEQFKEDKKHQITKEKYQELFTKKIEFYTTIHKELYDFHRQILHVGKEQFERVGREGNYEKIEITQQDVVLKVWKSINKIFQDNLFLISNEVEKQYQKILLGYEDYLVGLSEAEYYRYMSDEESYNEVYNDFMLGFFTEYKQDINLLIEILEKEIKIIKSDLGFDI